MNDRTAKADALEILARLYYSLDQRDYERVAAFFHPDGVWQRQGKRLEGPAQIIAALEQRSRTLVVHHIVTNPFFDVASDTQVKVTYYLTVYQVDTGNLPGDTAPAARAPQVGVCRAEFTRAVDSWRISHMAASPPTFRAAV